MNIELNNNQLTTLLLTTKLGSRDKELKHLSLGKWNSLVSKIIESELKEPSALLQLTEMEIREKLSIKDDDAKQIYRLLNKGAQLAIDLEDLNKRGIYILCRSDKNYPRLIKRKLKDKAPAVIFYSGNLELLNKKGIGMVGSRNIDSDILENTKFLSQKAIDEKFIVVSGGAKGVDSVSETAAFECGGGYISFICDSLANRIKKKEVRERIATGRVLYVTVDGPNYPFSAARAMNRNKFIYSLAEGTFILNSDYNSGGTWNGAVENMKKNLSATLVLNNNAKGNKELIKNGGIPVELGVKFSIKELLLSEKENIFKDKKTKESIQMDLFSELYRNKGN